MSSPPPHPGKGSTTSSLISPIQRSPYLHHDTYSSFTGNSDSILYNSGASSVGQDPNLAGNFNILDGSSEDSIVGSQHSVPISQRSEVEIYSDALDSHSLSNNVSYLPSDEQLRNHLHSPSNQSDSRGPVAVTPIRNSHIASQIYQDQQNSQSFRSFDFEDKDPNQMPEIETYDSKSSNLTPVTPRYRRTPLVPTNNLNLVVRPVSRPLSAEHFGHGSPSTYRNENFKSASHEKANKENSWVNKMKSRKLRNQENTVQRSQGHDTKPTLINPRKPSPASSTAGSSLASVSSDGHIEPQRIVREVPLSFIRRAGVTVNTNHAFLAGLPRAPYLPMKYHYNTISINNHSSTMAVSKEDKNTHDVWGRKQAGWLKSGTALLLCTCFPPLWLLLGTGYFDQLLGTVHRTAKIAALTLSVLTLAAGTAVVITISVIYQ